MQPLTPEEDAFATFIHNMGKRRDLHAMMDEIANALGMSYQAAKAMRKDLEERGIIAMFVGDAEASPVGQETAVCDYYQWIRKA
jgi:DNA-binding MarR family transcriptional regulator